MSGARVTSRLNGFGPVGVQRLLLGASLLKHAAAEGMVAPGFSNTLLTIVRSDNRKSLANVVAAGSEPPQERPDWFATEGTVRQAIAEMAVARLFGGTVRLQRTDRTTDLLEGVEIQVSLPDLAMGRPDLRAILAGQRWCGLSPPTAENTLSWPRTQHPNRATAVSHNGQTR